MKSLHSSSDYLIYLPFLGWCFLCIFIATGSVVAYRAKKNKVTFLMLLSSFISVLSILCSCFFAYKMVSSTLSISAHSSVSIEIDRIEKMEQYANYSMIASYTNQLSLLVFAFSFVIFCCNIANIRKRNEQLETLCQQLADMKHGARGRD